MGWKKNAKKTVSFEIAPQQSDVLVRIDFIPSSLNASDVRLREDQAKANWSELLVDLWVRFGETGAVQGAAVDAHIDWNLSLKKGRRMILHGAIIIAFGIVFAVVLAVLSPRLQIVPVGIMVVGVLRIFNGTMNARSAKRRLSAQNPTV